MRTHALGGPPPFPSGAMALVRRGVQVTCSKRSGMSKRFVAEVLIALLAAVSMAVVLRGRTARAAGIQIIMKPAPEPDPCPE